MTLGACFKIDKHLWGHGIITNNSSLGPKGPSDELFCDNSLPIGVYPLHKQGLKNRLE